MELADDRRPVDHSSVDHLLCNAGVVTGTFDDPRAARTLDIPVGAHPGPRVAGARPILARGGGPHRITRQQSAIPGGES